MLYLWPFWMVISRWRSWASQLFEPRLVTSRQSAPSTTEAEPAAGAVKDDVQGRLVPSAKVALAMRLWIDRAISSVPADPDSEPAEPLLSDPRPGGAVFAPMGTHPTARGKSSAGRTTRIAALPPHAGGDRERVLVGLNRVPEIPCLAVGIGHARPRHPRQGSRGHPVVGVIVPAAVGVVLVLDHDLLVGDELRAEDQPRREDCEGVGAVVEIRLNRVDRRPADMKGSGV